MTHAARTVIDRGEQAGHPGDAPVTAGFIDESARFRGRNLPNAMSIDVEDYFQVSAFEAHIPRSEWPTITPRLPANVDRILQLLADTNTSATFFTLGSVCERMPEVIRRIADAGHEIASHGYDHDRIWTLTPEQFREDVTKTRKILEDTSGTRIRGYRAPSFSIGQNNLWSLDVLKKTGHDYSSSIFPISHDHYGLPSAPRFPYRTHKDGILEVPPTTITQFGRNWPCAGGGYFRLLPMTYSINAIRRVCEREQMPAVFYFHPWEIDPGQPRVPGIPLKTRFRHYVNLSRMEARLARLLKTFRWDRMDTIYCGSKD